MNIFGNYEVYFSPVGCNILLSIFKKISGKKAVKFFFATFALWFCKTYLMKIKILSASSWQYATLLLCALATVQCSDNTEESIMPEPPYESRWYYSYDAESVLTAADFSIDGFIPYTLGCTGDTLFVANNADSSLLVIDANSERVLRTVKQWSFNGEQHRFESTIEAIVPSGDRLYVAERQSRIHCFSLLSWEYVGCIGNGNWWNDVFQAQAATAVNGFVFARDKDGKISLYRETDVTPENYQNVRRYCQSAGIGATNNNFATHCMRLDGQGHILLTDYNNKQIYTLDAEKAVNMENGASIDIAELTLTPDFAPTGMDITPDFYFVAGGNRAINIYDRTKKAWTKKLESIRGYTFSQPTCVQALSDSVLWISDLHKDKHSLVKLVVHKNEIREYVHENTTKVLPHETRSSDELFIALRTLEIEENPEI